MERYCVVSDSWSEVLGGELSQARSAIRVGTIQLPEVDFFDRLMDKAKRARQ
jgi:hypothetical protein